MKVDQNLKNSEASPKGTIGNKTKNETVFWRNFYCLGSICESTSGCELWSWIDSNYAGSSGATVHDCFLKSADAANSERPETGVVSGAKGCK